MRKRRLTQSVYYNLTRQEKERKRRAMEILGCSTRAFLMSSVHRTLEQHDPDFLMKSLREERKENGEEDDFPTG